MTPTPKSAYDVGVCVQSLPTLTVCTLYALTHFDAPSYT